MKTIIVIVCLALAALFMWMAQAYAHSWYSRTNCCNGSDCAPVPLDAGWVTMEEHGYQVTLTKEQAKQVNPDAEVAISVFIPWHNSRIKSPPVLKAGETYGANIYHLCIPPRYNGVYCLFVVPGL